MDASTRRGLLRSPTKEEERDYYTENDVRRGSTLKKVIIISGIAVVAVALLVVIILAATGTFKKGSSSSQPAAVKGGATAANGKKATVGKDGKLKRAPFQVGIWNTLSNTRCGGTILSKNTVLTSRRCVASRMYQSKEKSPAKDLLVMIGESFSLNPKDKKYFQRATRVFVHKQLAIVVMSKDFPLKDKDVMAVPVASRQVSLLRSKVMYAGYNSVGQGVDTSRVDAGTGIVERCSGRFTRSWKRRPRFCTRAHGTHADGSRTCFTDIGGAAIKDGSIVGVLHKVHNPKQCSRRTVSEWTDVRKYSKWVKSIVKSGGKKKKTQNKRRRRRRKRGKLRDLINSHLGESVKRLGGEFSELKLNPSGKPIRFNDFLDRIKKYRAKRKADKAKAKKSGKQTKKPGFFKRIWNKITGVFKKKKQARKEGKKISEEKYQQKINQFVFNLEHSNDKKVRKHARKQLKKLRKQQAKKDKPVCLFNCDKLKKKKLNFREEMKKLRRRAKRRRRERRRRRRERMRRRKQRRRRYDYRRDDSYPSAFMLE